MKIAVILNPRSGLPKHLPGIHRKIDLALRSFGHDVTIREISVEFSGAHLAREACNSGAELIIAGGGDGTIHRIGQTLIGTNIPLGVLPLGSGNGYARILGIPLQLEAALLEYRDPSIHWIDTGLAGDRPFLIACGLGLDARVAHEMERTKVRGVAPYIYYGLKRYLNTPPDSYRITNLNTGESWERSIMVVATTIASQYGGGAIVAPGAVPNDGKLELIEGMQVPIQAVPIVGVRLFSGRLDNDPRLIRSQIERVKIERLTDNREMHLDGEALFSEREIEISIQPKTLRVVVGDIYRDGWIATQTTN